MHGVISRQWTEWVVRGEAWKCVLVIETTLETNPGAPGYDRAALEEMIARDTDGLSASEYDHIKIVPLRAAAA